MRARVCVRACVRVNSLDREVKVNFRFLAMNMRRDALVLEEPAAVLSALSRA